MISVVNWQRHQHYGKEKPTWIKLYRDLLNDYEFMYHLEPEERWILVGIWLLAAETGNAIPGDLKYLNDRLKVDVKIELIRKLEAVGFITVTSISRESLEKVYTKKRREEKRRSTSKLVDGMWRVWLQELGGDPPHPKLTAKRKKLLSAFADEQLDEDKEPLDAFRAVLKTVKRSDHHMSQRSYQMPESLFRNEERRDRWMLMSRNGQAPTSGALKRPRVS